MWWAQFLDCADLGRFEAVFGQRLDQFRSRQLTERVPQARLADVPFEFHTPRCPVSRNIARGLRADTNDGMPTAQLDPGSWGRESDQLVSPEFALLLSVADLLIRPVKAVDNCIKVRGHQFIEAGSWTQRERPVRRQRPKLRSVPSEQRGEAPCQSLQARGAARRRGSGLGTNHGSLASRRPMITVTRLLHRALPSRRVFRMITKTKHDSKAMV